MNKLFLSLAATGVVLLGYGCKSADTENERQTLQMFKEINRKLNLIDARLKNIEGTQRVNLASGMNNNVDLITLEKITLPANPSREQVMEYIQKIVNISRNQRSFSSSDAQVAMLTRVGNKNLDLLLKYYNTCYYIQLAVQNIVTKDDKELILKALKENHGLIGVVTRMDWEKDAKDLILNELKTNHTNLSSQWIEAVVLFNDPKTYPDLIDYLINGNNSSYTYKAIKKLPGIELEDAVAKMWNKKRSLDFEWGKDNAATVAVEYGHLDALEHLINRLQNPTLQEYSSREIKNAVWQTTGQYGSPEELAKWVKEKRDNLTFDKKTGKFVVKKAEKVK